MTASEKPRTWQEPLIEGRIYRVVSGEGREMYRLLAGAMGTEVPSITLPRGYQKEPVEDSDFLPSGKFDEWVDEMRGKYPGLDEFVVYMDSGKWLCAGLTTLEDFSEFSFSYRGYLEDGKFYPAY